MSKRNPFDANRELLRKLLILERKNKKITQKELAEKLHKPQSFVSKYEIGERSLDVIELHQICLALDTTLTTFIIAFEQKIHM